MKKANVEEIWRKHGWVPPSKEDPEVIKRQANSRGEFSDLPVVQPIQNQNFRDEGIPCT